MTSLGWTIEPQVRHLHQPYRPMCSLLWKNNAIPVSFKHGNHWGQLQRIWARNCRNHFSRSQESHVTLGPVRKARIFIGYRYTLWHQGLRGVQNRRQWVAQIYNTEIPPYTTSRGSALYATKLRPFITKVRLENRILDVGNSHLHRRTATSVNDEF